HLHAVSLQLQILREKCANLLKHAPRCFIRHACFPLDLLCGDSAACRRHQVHGIKPETKRRAGLLENGSCHWRDHAAAIIASVCRTTANPMVLALCLALLTVPDAAWKPLFFEKFKAGVIVWKLRVEIVYRVSQVLRD